MNGKEKCRILKDIRRQIAEENDIGLVIEECTHKGACRGTCPRCEAEVRYLERELEKRRRLRKRVALAGISLGVSLALTGCAAVEQMIENLLPDPSGTGKPTQQDGGEVFQLDGEVGPEDYVEFEAQTTGMVAPTEMLQPEVTEGN